MFSACVAPACVNLALNCPAASVSVYAPAAVYTPPILPLSASASVYAAPSIYASAIPTYPASSAIYPTTLASTIYPSVLPSAPIYSSTVLGATLPAASVYSTTALGTPIYNGNVVYGNGFYDNGFNSNFNANLGLGGGLLNYNGNPIDANIRNSFYANALAPIIPGIGGTVSTFNNLNLLANGGQTFDNILNGRGGRGDPFGNFVRNSYFANSIGAFAPGLSGPLNQLNQLNLLGSLFR
jgi:hypothetical protein